MARSVGVDPERLLWTLACREQIGLLAPREIFEAARAILEIDWSEALSELVELDRLEDPAVMTLFHRDLAYRGVPVPSLLEAAWGFVLDTAVQVRSGRLEPREGVLRMVEVLYRIEKLGGPADLLTDLNSAHALMTLRDDAHEIVRSSSGMRAWQFRKAVADYDDHIRDFSGRLLTAVGLSKDASLAEIRAAAVAKAGTPPSPCAG